MKGALKAGLILFALAAPALSIASSESGSGHGGHGEVHAPPPVNWVDMGYKNKDAHGGSLEAGDEPMAPPLVFALLNFAVFVGLIVKFAGPKIKTGLRSRHDTIKSDLAEAARLRSEAETKLAEYSVRMAKVQNEVDQLISDIRADAESEKRRILDDARAQAQALKKDAEERITNEIARARSELEREVVKAAVAAAQKILAEQATASDQKVLFDNFLDHLKPTAQAASKGLP